MLVTLQILLLLIFSSTQCMELGISKKSCTVQINHHLIDNFLRKVKKNKSNPLLLFQQTKRLHLLKKIINKEINLSFSNQDKDILFWINKDKQIIRNILNEKFLFLINHKTNQQKNVLISYVPSSIETPFYISLQIKNSVLDFTATNCLNSKTAYIIKKFLREYVYNAQVQELSNPPTDALQIDCQESSSSNEKNNDIDELQSLKLPNDEYELFMTLPYNTQTFLKDIILEK